MKSIDEFDFYENLRYILPGYFFLFIVGPLLMPEYWRGLDASEKIVYGFVIGFLMHSFGLYKIVPGYSSVKKKHIMKHVKLTGKKPSQIFFDVMSFTFAEEKHLFKRYYGLGALKLDVVMTLIFTVIIQIYVIINKLIIHPKNFTPLLPNFLFILGIAVVTYIVKEDGINDIKRAFNLELFVIARGLKEENGLTETIQTIENENLDIFFSDERKIITDFTKSIREKIK